jgi:hypothetical protein
VAENRSKRLTAEDAHTKSGECRTMAKHAAKSEHRIMLEHMADTWERIALNLGGESGQRGPCSKRS